MSNEVTLDQVEQLAMQLFPEKQLRMVAHISEKLSRLGLALPSSDKKSEQLEHEVREEALLQELDEVEESIKGEFDSAEVI